MYGLRKSPRAWYECFDDYIRSLNFKRSESDYCLHFKDVKRERIFLILFADDLLVCGKKVTGIAKIKANLSEKFAMKDLGKVKTYLGINIEYESERGVMTLDQTNYLIP